MSLVVSGGTAARLLWPLRTACECLITARQSALRRTLAGGAALMMVPLVRDTGRPTRANVSMDAGTLAAIDEEAAARGLTRSASIAGAALEKIRRGT